MKECVKMGFKIIPVCVKLDSLEMTVESTSMNANLHVVSMAHAQIYLMTTNAHAMQDSLVEIVPWYQQEMFAIHTLVSMEVLVLRILMIQVPVIVLPDTLGHSVKLMSMSA